MILWYLGAIICACGVGVEAIDGGSFVRRKEVPYYVRLVTEDDGFCGGSIISDYWVITAAHCIVFVDMEVLTGADISHEVEKVIVHGYYDDEPNYNNDIALIKLKTPIKFNELQQPIKMKTTPPKIGGMMLVSGFGDQGRSRGTPPVLKSTLMPIVSCDEEDENPRLFICAGVHGTLSCPGDSGGPVVIDGELGGIVSHGPYCDEAESEDADVYTRLDTYVEWVRSHVTP